MNRDKAARVIQRRFRKRLQEERHRNDTTPSRRTNVPISGSHDYLAKGRGIIFPVGVKSNGELIWRTEDVDFLARWFSSTSVPTNPWTREKLGDPTLPRHVYTAVMRKAVKKPVVLPNSVQQSLNAHNESMRQWDILENETALRSYLENSGDPNAFAYRTNIPLLHWHARRLVSMDVRNHPVPVASEIAAINNRNVRMVRSLLEAGANPNTIHDGYTLLNVLCLSSHRAISGGGRTSVHGRQYVVKPDAWMTVIRLMLEHGADPNIKSSDDKTPLDHLLGCYDIEEENSTGHLPIRLECIKLIREHGGNASRDVIRETRECLSRRIWKLVRMVLH